MTFIPASWDFTIYQGARFDTTLTINGYDFAGYHARMQIRRTYADADDEIVLDMTESNYLTFTRVSDTVSTLDIDIGGDVTEGLDVGSYLYDLELYTSASNIRRIAYGEVTLSREVTRD